MTPWLRTLIWACKAAALHWAKELTAAQAEVSAEIARLRREGTPGVMHEVDEAFYRLTVKERDLERRRVDRLHLEVQALQRAVADTWRSGQVSTLNNSKHAVVTRRSLDAVPFAREASDG